ncbi:hypothetical protein GQ55_9G385400 [Panicum hallii var. hallii]|uniref:Uncharacterized protein n=2 Tax=Panicum hallii TaxID=206008 RepID=A0A2T7C9E0_9POAL|nr:hypothetical protein GQ55_9G385400 [Panicum hallii var. hallii]PVH32323.1 hypothetical protein PAHAL_9G372700 [Panicum hallii]
MEEEEGAHEVYQGGSSLFMLDELRIRVRPPLLSPTIVNICRTFSSGLPHNTEMLDDDDDDEEDADYKLEEEEEEQEVEALEEMQ